MLNNVVEILKKNENISGWLINMEKVHSGELFFIKDKLQMNRKKDVTHLTITVYKNFSEEGSNFTGSARCELAPGMTADEMKEKIDKAAFSAGFVKNPEFKLIAPEDSRLPVIKSSFSAADVGEFLPKISKAIYKEDNHTNGKVNSCEIFLEKNQTTVMNSEGVNESYTSYAGEIELVVDWKEHNEEVEVIEQYTFSDFDEEKISGMVKKAFEKAQNRAIAQKAKLEEGTPVILTGEAVEEFLGFYLDKASAAMVYKKYSSAKIGESIQGNDASGDKVSITMVPELYMSSDSKYIDSDGVKLKETVLYENGVLKSYIGDSKHCQYLGIKPTGRIPNAVFKSGSTPKEALINDGCLEVLSFSAFGVDPLTGDFGGEIRLGYVHEEGKKIPVTGGSVTGNVTKVHDDMLFSIETEVSGSFSRPEAIKINGARLSS